MYGWMKRIHMYSGLLSFMAFVVWGVTGISAVFLPAPGKWQPPEVSSEQQAPFAAPGNLDDKQLAKLIFEKAGLSMAGGYYDVHRDDQGNLAFLSYTANGPRDITYREDQKLIQIKFRRNDLADFLSSMHAEHSRRGSPDLSSRLWGYYNEFSTWAFLFMVLSGIYLWVATRPRLPWAQLSLGAATLFFAILWVTTR